MQITTQLDTLYIIYILLLLIQVLAIICISRHNSWFKRTLIYFDTDTQSATFQCNPLCQATKRHLNNS